ncbi:MAG: hypothetical protein IJ643_05170 [Eubacterium sp.]|nr:hypothetical protein [Eubacterium sp.]
MISKTHLARISNEIDNLKNRKSTIVLHNYIVSQGVDNDAKTNSNLNNMIDSYIKDHKGSTKESTIYEDVIEYLNRLNNKTGNLYVRKNGAINESRFYNYAYIDKSTWSSLKYNLILPKKKTILKLAIALHLSEDEAIALMNKANNSFDFDDTQDLVILALLNMKVYNIETVIETLEYYQQNTEPYFDCIYDTPEEQAIKRTEYNERKERKKKEHLASLKKSN